MGHIIAATLGECVHVAGVLGFLGLAKSLGYTTTFLGTRMEPAALLGAIYEVNPDQVALGYRLTPHVARILFQDLADALQETALHPVFIFGGTTAVANVAREFSFFSHVFDGATTKQDVIRYLTGEKEEVPASYEDTLLARLEKNAPLPLFRHHFGLPSLRDTEKGIREIAGAKVVDVLSLGVDQGSQEYFFRPQERKDRPLGQGGVPLQKREDLVLLYEASRTGNFPLLRSYSGTFDVFSWARLLHETLGNAWCAVPLSWYNVLDGRGPRSLLSSMTQAKALMRLHARLGIPVECNEAHHWSLRDAHDTVYVVMGYLGANMAKAVGVKTYIAPFMLSTPPSLYPTMDLAKQLATKALIESLEDPTFRVLIQVRAGLMSFPPDLSRAKGQLGYASFLGMQLAPDIVHVVGFCEASHVATPKEVIESLLIARQVVEQCRFSFHGASDERVLRRKEYLLKEARDLLFGIQSLAPDKKRALEDPRVLSSAISMGFIHAPQLIGHSGVTSSTGILAGACEALDPKTKKVIREKERIARICAEFSRDFPWV